jgi:hypothetical protein
MAHQGVQPQQVPARPHGVRIIRRQFVQQLWLNATSDHATPFTCAQFQAGARTLLSASEAPSAMGGQKCPRSS